MKFLVQPSCGMPQGAPESPLLYACLMEDLIHLAEDKLAFHGKSAGLPVRPPEVDMDPETVATTCRPTAYTPSCMTYLNFADDTYVLAMSETALCFSTSVVASDFARTGQLLNDSKSEVLISHNEVEHACRVRVWLFQELNSYVHDDILPSRHTAREFAYMKPVTKIKILASTVAAKVCNAGHEAIAHRVQCAWKSRYASRDQLCARSTPLRLRVQLLDTVVGATLL